MRDQRGFSIPNRNTLHPKGRNAFSFSSEEFKKYYSSLEMEIYFGGGTDAISDLLGLQFVVQQNAMPLFGYNSYTFDDLAVGSRIVNGTFSLHFTRPRMLYELTQLPPDIVENYFLTQGEPSPQEDLEDKDEEVEQELEEIESGGTVNTFSERPLWDGRFDIVIQYGDPINEKDRILPPARITILDVQIISSTQGHDISGEPVVDTYNFIARDIMFEDPGYVADRGDEEAETTPEETDGSEAVTPFTIYAYAKIDEDLNNKIYLRYSNLSPGISIELVQENLDGARFSKTNIVNEYSVVWNDFLPDKIAIKTTYASQQGSQMEIIEELVVHSKVPEDPVIIPPADPDPKERKFEVSVIVQDPATPDASHQVEFLAEIINDGGGQIDSVFVYSKDNKNLGEAELIPFVDPERYILRTNITRDINTVLRNSEYVQVMVRYIARNGTIETEYIRKQPQYKQTIQPYPDNYFN